MSLLQPLVRPTIGTYPLIHQDAFTYEMYFYGCMRKCFKCHNPELQSIPANAPRFTPEEYLKFFDLNNELIKELHILGGEPLFSDVRILWLIDFITRIREFTDWLVVLFTGKEFNELTLADFQVIFLCDYVKIGPFVHSLGPKQYGNFVLASSNQIVYKIENNSLVKLF